jgi:hypothetical protein
MVQDITSSFIVTPVTISVTDICPPTAAEEFNPQHFRSIIFPNPSMGNFIVHSEEENLRLAIVNSQGQIIYHAELTNPETEIDLHAIPQGIYFYLLTTQTGIKASGKLAIE